MVNYCQKCGSKVDEGDNFCAYCGAKLKDHTKKTKPWSAALLGLIFGPFGYIYLRRYLRSLVCLWAFLIICGITGGKALPILIILFSLDCYRISKKQSVARL